MLREDLQRGGNAQGASENVPLMEGSPKGGTFYDMLFPDMSPRRIIVWISFAQIIIYILSCLLSENLTAPSVQALMFLGATYGPAIKQGEIWRLLFPIFLHANWWHLIINIMCMLNLGLVIESKYKKGNFFFLYFLSGVVGNILTTICNPCQLAVGASTSGFGLIGFSILEIFLAWANLSRRAKNYYIFNVSVFVLFFLFVSFSPTVDFFGHIGGFLCGAFLACHYNKAMGYDFFQTSLYYSFACICALIVLYLPVRLYVTDMPCVLFH
ncbi:rhomboid protease [Plasmodium cynomolgi strain B]|uniref:Rhomboid-like protease n=1 Tax=Plasmodium cynomolgi (strain B) TaxID=1120755 RepID=K6USX3_PLACD|nr:rhomboid protease [Plasmodium cynomolgi strain B]GAB65115.1 rhomboid protease [Plasmodium cynomolgi strain B]